jgi:hypothetical protein
MFLKWTNARLVLHQLISMSDHTEFDLKVRLCTSALSKALWGEKLQKLSLKLEKQPQHPQH